MSDSETEHPREIDIKTLFQKALNRHGHPFQYAVIRRAKELHGDGSSWVFDASEFPVEVQGHNTHVDFILSRLPMDGPYGFLVAECKRVNPSLSNWLFATAPYVRRNGSSPHLLFECVKRDKRDIISGAMSLPSSERIYHVALEAKSKEKGDTSGGRGAIEEAITQVTKGINGLIERLSKKLIILPDASLVTFIPAIFTTAQLWVTNADLGKTDLLRGEIDLSTYNVEKKPWLWLQHNISPSLKHSLEPGISVGISGIRNDISQLLRLEYARTIAIVSTDGIDDFLKKDFLST